VKEKLGLIRGVSSRDSANNLKACATPHERKGRGLRSQLIDGFPLLYEVTISSRRLEQKIIDR